MIRDIRGPSSEPVLGQLCHEDGDFLGQPGAEDIGGAMAPSRPNLMFGAILCLLSMLVLLIVFGHK